MKTAQLQLFYDDSCPFCSAEMQRLKSWNHAGNLDFVDISQVDFDPANLGVSMQDLDRELHGLTSDGQLLVGIDSILLGYRLVGKSWLVWPLRVKLLRPGLSALYRAFARNRYQLSALLGYKKSVACQHGRCELKHPFFHQRSK